VELQGSRTIAATQQQVWDALIDPEVLKVSIPGCDKVERTAENQFQVGVAVKVGPVSARFSGRITLADIEAPNRCTIIFDGQGGAAGFGKGSAEVSLAPADEGRGCELSYLAKAQVGGKIAQVGQRLVDGVARSMAEEFFNRFDAEMQRRYPPADAAQGQASAPATATPASRIPNWVWAAIGIVVVIGVGFWLLR